jgi:hypothetical protein
MTLPAGVQVLVRSGYARCEPAASAGDASTVVGMGMRAGARAPPPSRVSGYARSSADSSYSTYPPRPPRDEPSFDRGGPGSSYMSACYVPLPRSRVGTTISAYPDDWEVVEKMDGHDECRMADDTCSIAPSESVSSVGIRRGAATYYSRHH